MMLTLGLPVLLLLCYAFKAWRAHPGSAIGDSVTSNGEMVDFPASPVTQLPHQRLAHSAENAARLVQLLQDSSSRISAQKTGRKPPQAHALEPTGSRKLLTSPPWHGDCFLPWQSRHWVLNQIRKQKN